MLKVEKAKMIILGIDPGYAIIGYGVISYNGNRFTVLDYGAITTEAGLPMARRLELIYEGVRQLIIKYSPDAMAVEELFFNTNAKTVIGVGQARGVNILAGVKSGVEIAEYTPLQVKQALTGYGRAEKNQVIQMVPMCLNLKKAPKPDDVADALAIAVCHAYSAGSRITDALRRGF